MVLFDYQEGRGREGPVNMLKDFTGHLQTDGYAVYDIFNEKQDVILLHCMAHARRMFYEALQNDKAKAEMHRNNLDCYTTLNVKPKLNY